jgi:demethylmenaquinone methyltransferase/2-methoxy-6-polyprenyl-1,4-benzoquinol methylase
MLEIGRQKVAKLAIGKNDNVLQQGDSEALPFPDRHFDAVTVAFGVRNFEHLEKGLREMGRVLKPGGKLIVLEFSQPRTPGIRQVYEALPPAGRAQYRQDDLQQPGGLSISQ